MYTPPFKFGDLALGGIKKCKDCGKISNELIRHGRATKCPHCGSTNKTKISGITAGKLFGIIFVISIVAGLFGGFIHPNQPYTNGAEISSENEEGGKWFTETKAKAEAGNPGAQTTIGFLYYHGQYYNGQEYEQDLSKAAKWYQKAANQGLVKAQINLAAMYLTGQGVGQDYKEAFKWYQKAANQGDANAQYNLGTMYQNGRGVEQSHVTAHAWWNISATNGNRSAYSASTLSDKAMSSAQNTEIEELIKEMIKKNPKLLN